jgi:hypothetical protein
VQHRTKYPRPFLAVGGRCDAGSGPIRRSLFDQVVMYAARIADPLGMRHNGGSQVDEVRHQWPPQAAGGVRRRRPHIADAE